MKKSLATTQFGVTVRRSVRAEELVNCSTFPYNHVIDLRHTEDGTSAGIEEPLLVKLQNYWISYEQLPMDPDKANARMLNALWRSITDNRNVLVLTTNVTGIASFCSEMDIPCKSETIHVVADSEKSRPAVRTPRSNDGIRQHPGAALQMVG